MVKNLDYNRFDLHKLLKGHDNIGIELGVAAGSFSSMMVRSGAFKIFIGVDMYQDNHDVNEYKTALKEVGLDSPYKLLRMRFDEALDLFDDNYFDFVYVDGYAHTGEEGGKTLTDWLSKVKIGGVIAGDDYHEKWPLVKAAVNRFIDDTGFDLMVSQTVEQDVKFSNYPSWACIKSREIDIEPDKSLEIRGKLGRCLGRFQTKN